MAAKPSNWIYLNRYETIRLLGEGAMGRVYLAKDTNLGRQVVVKAMQDQFISDPEFCERFRKETLLMARFQHPHAVTLYDASLDDPQGPCIIMEYVPGISLDVLLQKNKGKLLPGRVARLLNQLCEVLQVAHQEGIVHCDLKPANLMIVNPDTPGEKVKAMDFGLAKMFFDADGENVFGTPTHISPEQAHGVGLDHRSDLYSVGVILYEMLTGRLPFPEEPGKDLLLAHDQETPPAFADIGATDVSSAVERVVMSCLAKDPAQRPASARDLARAFQAAVMNAPAATPAPPAPPAPTTKAPEQPAVNTEGSMVFRLDEPLTPVLAQYKLLGFMQENGGKLLEKSPGKVRIQLGGRSSPYQLKAGLTGWLGISRKAGLVEICMTTRPTPNRADLHDITISMCSLDGDSADNPVWQDHCRSIYLDLSRFLRG